MSKINRLALVVMFAMLLSTVAWSDDSGLSPVVNLEPDIEKYESGKILLKIYDRYSGPDLSFDQEAGTVGENGITGLSELYQEFGVTSVKKLFAFARPNPELPHDLTTCYEIEYESGIDAKEVAERFSLIAEIEFAEPDFIAQMTLRPNDPDMNNQSYLSSVNAEAAWDITTCDATQVIGIIDTGVDINHVDLADNIFVNEAEKNGIPGIDDDGNGFVDDINGWDFVNDDNLPMDDNSHGTHVAGIAAAKTDNNIGIAGIAWNAKILPIKVLQSSGRGSYSDVAQGVTYGSLNDGTVLNMSLGGYSESQTLKYALENAYHYSFLVAAAGNDGLGLDCVAAYHYPACYSWVMGVQAAGARWSNYDCTGPYKASNSNGFNYEVKYPGVSILSTIPGNKYKKCSGTSMASPIVAGAAALLKSHFPNISHEEMFTRLIESGMDIEKALSSNFPPKLELYSITVLDTLDGDSDGRPDAGETIQLQVTAKNFGFLATDVVSKLRPGEYEDKSTCTITDSICNLGNVSSYARVDNWDNTFEIVIDDDIANDRDIVFEVEFACSNSATTFIFDMILTAQNGVEINGIYSGVTHLKANRNYIITSNSFVDTLIVDPGTKINSSSTLFIKNYVSISGTPDSLILFEGNGKISGTSSSLPLGKQKFSYIKNGKFDFYFQDVYEPGIYSYGPVYSNCILDNIPNQSRGEMNCNFSDATRDGERYCTITNSITVSGSISDLSVNTGLRNSYLSSPALVMKNTFDGRYYDFTNDCYLGTSRKDSVEQRVIDYFDDDNKAIVQIKNFLEQPSQFCHGHVWTIKLDNIDIQDEAKYIEPISSETKKIDVYFNRAMDTTQTPFLTFGVRSPYTQKVISDSAKWVNWNIDSTLGETIYHVQVCKDTNFTNNLFDDDSIRAVSTYINGLDSSQYYYWRIRFKNIGDSCWNKWYKPRSFTSINRNKPLTRPIITSPRDNSKNLYTGIVLYWNMNSLLSDTTEILIAHDTLFSDIYKTKKILSIMPSWYELIDLEKDHKYFVKMRYINGFGAGDWSDIVSFTTYKDSVIAPDLIYPESNQDSISTKFNLFTITSNKYVNKTFLQISDKVDFSTIKFSKYYSTGHYLEDDLRISVNVNLDTNKKYYWRVKSYYNYSATISSQYSAVDSFTTFCQTNVIKPKLISPENNLQMTGDFIDFKYAPPVNVYGPPANNKEDEICIEISESNSFDNIVFSYINAVSMLGDLTVHESSLNFGQKYYWRARFQNYYGEPISDWSDTLAFTYETNPNILCVPSDGARGQKTDSLLLKWNNAPGANTVYDARWQAYFKFDYKTGDGLQRVRVAGARDNEYFEIPVEDYRFNFEVQATSGASNNFMADGDVGKINLEWDKPEDDGWLGFNVYRFIQKDSVTWGDTVKVNSNLVLDSVFTDYTVIPDSNYFYVYRILRSSLEESDDSKVVSASAYPEILEAPNLLAPTNDTTNLETSVRFDWDEPSGAQTYVIQIARDELFTDIYKSETGLTVSELLLDNMPNNTRYFWKVKADGIQGTSSWSEIFSFTVKPLLPEVPVLTYPTDDATQILTNVTLDWDPAAHATSYQLQVSKASNFSNPVFDILNISSSSKNISGLTLNTEYFWRVRGKNDAGFGLWSNAQSFTTDSAAYYEPPTNWTFVDSTGSNATIIISKNLDITIDEQAIEVGDAIGVFYRDGSTRVCAGNATWTGQNLAITVWGDNDQTTEKDGFDDGEKYKIMLWDGRGGEEFASKLSFDQGNDYYSNNGISYVSFLQSVETETHSLNLAKGWNMVSTYVEPEIDSLADLTSDISSGLFLMKNGAGKIYLPSYGIDQIKNWDYETGYLFYMTSSAILDIEGLPAAADTKIQLAKGWNMIAYLHDTDQDLEAGMADIETTVFLVKNGGGKIYLPSYGINQIGNLETGQGYLLYMNVADSLTYPVPGGSLKAPAIAYTPFETKFEKPNAQNATVILESNLPEGTEIEAVNSIGVLIGSGKVEEGRAVIAIYGDDEYTDAIDGARTDEEIRFEAIEGNIRTDLAVEEVSSILSGEEYDAVRFATNAVYLVKIASETPQAGAGMTITPNPAKDEAILSLNFTCRSAITIEIYDNKGNLMQTAYTGDFTKQISLDTSDLPACTYRAVVRMNDDVKSVRFVVVR
jgi:subtilisin family serine protease